MNWPVRRVRDGAAAEAALLAVEGHAAAAAYLADLLAREDVHLLVAYDDVAPIGFVYGYELPRLKRTATGMLLYEIEVLASHRRRGVGRSLMAAFDELRRVRGCDSHWLVTNESNPAAMRLYETTGGTRGHSDDVMFEFGKPR